MKPIRKYPHFLQSMILTQMYTLRKKRYKSCHWGCTFSKGKLLYILGVNMYILGANKYILGANMYIFKW